MIINETPINMPFFSNPILSCEGTDGYLKYGSNGNYYIFFSGQDDCQ